MSGSRFMALALVLCFCLVFPGHALSTNLTVSAVGKDAATAELNARVTAVRQTLQSLADKGWLNSQANTARETFILRSKDYTSDVKILSSTTEKNLVRVQAAVEVDEQKMRDTLLALSPSALSEAAKKTPPAPAESKASETAQSSQEPSPSSAASADAESAKENRTAIALLTPICDATAATVTAQPGDRSITYTDVRLAYEEEGIVFVIDTLVLTGIDQNSYDGSPGELTTVDKVAFSGCRLLMEEQPLAVLEDYTIEGYALKYRDLLQILQGSKEAEKEQIMLKMAPILNAFKADKVYGKNLTANVAILTASIASFEARDISMASYGPSVLNNLQVSLMGSNVFSLGKMGCNSVKLPPILVNIMDDPEGFLAKNQDLMQKFAQDPLSVLSPFEIKEFYFEDMAVTAGAPFALKKFSNDIIIQNGELQIKSIVEDLLVKRDVLAAVPNFAPVMGILRSDLQCNALVDLILRIKQGRADISVDTKLRENALGGFALALGLDLPLSGMEDVLPLAAPESGSSSDDSEINRIKHFDLSVENNGFIDFLIACYTAYDSESEGYEAMRKEIIDSIDAILPSAAGKFQKAALEALSNLLKQGGTLKASLKPSQPVNIDELPMADDQKLEQMGLNISYTPPAGTR